MQLINACLLQIISLQIWLWTWPGKWASIQETETCWGGGASTASQLSRNFWEVYGYTIERMSNNWSNGIFCLFIFLPFQVLVGKLGCWQEVSCCNGKPGKPVGLDSAGYILVCTKGIFADSCFNPGLFFGDALLHQREKVKQIFVKKKPELD